MLGVRPHLVGALGGERRRRRVDHRERAVEHGTCAERRERGVGLARIRREGERGDQEDALRRDVPLAGRRHAHRDDLDRRRHVGVDRVQPGEHLLEEPDRVHLHGRGEEAVEGTRAEVEPRHDAREASDRRRGPPREVGVRVRVGAHQLAVGRDHLDRRHLLGRPTPAAGVPALAALQEEAADADARAVAAAEEAAPLLEERAQLVAAPHRGSGRHDPRLLVEADAVQRREIDRSAPSRRLHAAQLRPPERTATRHPRSAAYRTPA